MLPISRKSTRNVVNKMKTCNKMLAMNQRTLCVAVAVAPRGESQVSPIIFCICIE